jgi:hypothetical protein
MALPAKPGEINYALADRFTAAHAAVAMVLGRLAWGAIPAPKPR